MPAPRAPLRSVPSSVPSFDPEELTLQDTGPLLGIEVRAGLHTGECETIDGKIGGLGVSIGARVGAAAEELPTVN